jgi:hypothetical protein
MVRLWREHQLQLSHKPGGKCVRIHPHLPRQILRAAFFIATATTKPETADNILTSMEVEIIVYRLHALMNVKPGLWQVKVTTEEGLSWELPTSKYLTNPFSASKLITRILNCKSRTL